MKKFKKKKKKKKKKHSNSSSSKRGNVIVSIQPERGLEESKRDWHQEKGSRRYKGQ